LRAKGHGRRLFVLERVFHFLELAINLRIRAAQLWASALVCLYLTISLYLVAGMSIRLVLGVSIVLVVGVSIHLVLGISIPLLLAMTIRVGATVYGVELIRVFTHMTVSCHTYK